MTENAAIADVKPSTFAIALGALNGLAMLILGILILSWPGVTLALIAILFGIQLAVMGTLQIVAAAKATSALATRVVVGVLGLFVVIAGVICLFQPFTSLRVLVIFTAIGWISDAIATFIRGGREDGGRRWLAWLLGVVSLVGAVVLLVWPAMSLLALVTFAGWLLIAFGAVELVASLFGKPRPIG